MHTLLQIPMSGKKLPPINKQIQRQIDCSRGDMTCTDCNFTFKNEEDFVWHMNQHEHGKDRKCSGCLLMFATKNSVDVHYESEHMRIQYICPGCGKKFSNKANMKSHIRKNHENHKQLIMQCFVYPSKFTTKRTEEFKHRKTKSIGPNATLCDRCKARVTGNIARHKQSDKCRNKVEKLMEIERALGAESDTEDGSSESDVDN